MTDLLQLAIEKARQLPEDEQDIMAETMLTFSDISSQDVYIADAEDRASITRGRADAQASRVLESKDVWARIFLSKSSTKNKRLRW